MPNTAMHGVRRVAFGTGARVDSLAFGVGDTLTPV